MGNSHSSGSTAGRRRSLLREEFMFPELDLQSSWDCDLYCVDVELQPLPPHAHHAHHVCVDDYTQELLSWEGKCVCSCHASPAAETEARRPRTEGDKDVMRGCLQDQTGAQEFCVHWDVYPEGACSLDAGGPESMDDLCDADLLDILLDQDMALKDPGRRSVENSFSSPDIPYNEDCAEANIAGTIGTEEPVPGSQRTGTTQESTELKDSLDDNQSRKVFRSASTLQKEPSAYTEQKCDAVMFHVWTDPRYNKPVLETRPITTTASERNAVQDQTPRSRDGGMTVHPRRRSCSIPMPQSHAAAMHFQHQLASKRRKFSLKDDPGWIPNPLDSDSDGDDLEDSGIFSDSTGSPAMSASPLSCSSFTPRAAAAAIATAAATATTTTTAAAKQSHSLQRQRRRCNSEPMSEKSTTSPYSPLHTDLSSPTSGSSTVHRKRRGWGILRLRGRSKKAERVEDPAAQGEGCPHDDEDDLTEQLRWLTMSDSQLSQDAGVLSEREREEDLDTRHTAEDLQDTQDIATAGEEEEEDFFFFHAGDTATEDFSNSRDTSLRAGRPAKKAAASAGGESREPPSTEEGAVAADAAAAAATERRVNRFDGELELDWLCEPEWNNLELELFWSVLRPHLEHLLRPEDSELLPEACGPLGHMDAGDPKLLDRCLLHVQWHIWKGSYRQAVSDFRAIRRHFLCCAQSQLIESATRDDVENLRLLFQRKRPTRFRLWI